jgi:PelA/Pel-15E family pectate lyase
MRTLLLVVLLPMHAAVIGVSKPAPSLTVARVMSTLPAGEQAQWLTYLRRSQQQLAFDQDEPFVERSHLKGPVPAPPKEGYGTRAMPLDRDAEFYKSATALHTADTIVSFQIPNGGWSKNLDMGGLAREPGQSYTANNLSRFLGPDKDGQPDFDQPANPNWNYAGTLDNDATNTQLRFLARVSTAVPGREGDRFRASFIRGIYFLLHAQFPNGGWPQVWPLEGGYHDAITYNDNAVTQAASLLHEAAVGGGDFKFLPAGLRAEAGAAADRAVACIVRTQVVIAGRKTVWAQQHDALTLVPVSGRNYEPAALSAGESADILMFLMKLKDASAEVREAIEAGVAWLRAHAIEGQAWGALKRADGAA